MKRVLLGITAACLLFASCNNNTKTPAGTTNKLPEGFTIEGKDGAEFTYSAEDKTITLSSEGTPEYTLSGDFEGMIIVMADDTVINLSGAKLSNSNAPAINSEYKYEVSAKRDTENSVLVSGDYDETNKTGAINGAKKIKIGGAGKLEVSGSVNHGIKSSKSIEVKGSGNFTISGSSEGSAINCNIFEVEPERTFYLTLKNSKNGIKADKYIAIESGTFILKNLTTGFKTDKGDGEPHFVTIAEKVSVTYDNIKKKYIDTDPVDTPEA